VKKPMTALDVIVLRSRIIGEKPMMDVEVKVKV
jgi:hypothetical protein